MVSIGSRGLQPGVVSTDDLSPSLRLHLACWNMRTESLNRLFSFCCFHGSVNINGDKCTPIYQFPELIRSLRAWKAPNLSRLTFSTQTPYQIVAGQAQIFNLSPTNFVLDQGLSIQG